MKILFFSDLHGDFATLRNLRKKSVETDLVVSAGDFSSMERDLPELVSQLNSFQKPVLMIHGNHEEEEGMRELCNQNENITFLHKAVHHVGDYIFMGYGGDGFSTNDSNFTKVANMFFKKEAKDKKRMILVTHGPPYNTKIDFLGNEPRGNKSYRQFIDDIQPHLAISGHLHENSGKHHKIGRTLFINPGKEGVIVNI
jgi:Icc-related predicted phosphoesterase